MTRDMRRIALPALVLLVACGAEREPPIAPQASAAPLTADRFCDAYATHMCDANAACACAIDDGCVARAKKSCETQLIGADTRAALESEAMAFDAVRAGDFLDAIDRTDCRDTFATLEWSQRDLLDFGGVFVGMKQPGEACSIPFFAVGPNECDRGVCVAQGEGYACVAVADVGEACGNTARGEVRCLDHDAPVARAYLGPERVFGPCVEGVCAARLHEDAPCAADGWCQSGRCEQLRRPTAVVEAHLDLDRFARESSAVFAADDPASYQYRLTTRIVDRHAEPRDLQLYLFRGSETEWGYSAMVDDEVVAVGALAFSDDGALEVDYALTQGLSFDVTSSLGPIDVDFGDSLAEGGTGFEGTRLADDSFAVRRLAGDQIESSPFCAARLLDGSECRHDVDCASGACGPRGERSVCLPADRAYGVECAVDGECASGACVSGVCGASWCG